VDGGTEKGGVSSLRLNQQLGIKERIRHMEQDTVKPEYLSIRPRDVLTDLLRQRAQEMLATAIENEVAEYIERHAAERDDQGHRLVVRNGRLPARQIQTGLGLVEVQQPRVNDRRLDEKGERVRFSSAILPPYLRRTKSLDELIPWLYLRGISTGDFTEALQALLGPQAQGLSATNIVRLKECWQQEWKDWSKQSLAEKTYVYWWPKHMAQVLQSNMTPCYHEARMTCGATVHEV